MEKTWWWRALTSFISGGVLLFGWIYDNYFCFTSRNSECLFDQYREMFIEPIIIFSAFLCIVSAFLFFINDKIFLKWLRFAAGWIVFSILVLILVPDQQAGLFSFGDPDKEQISVWLGSLFVILSLAKIGWEWRREKKR
jgi:hypothetical protein